MNAVINVPICPIMSQPSRFSTLADEGLYGAPVEVLERPAAGWCKVITHYGYAGYAAESCLLFGESAVGAWAVLPKKVVLHKNTCDILAGPRIQARLLLSLTRGALVHSAEKETDGWEKIWLCDGHTGYTRSSFLDEYYEHPSATDVETLRRRLQDTAALYMGTHYRWGGKTPLGIDCSGLVFMAYFLNGMIIWRDAQIKEGYPIHEIDCKSIKRGDLLFFPGHVAMYMENGLYIHSTGAPGSDGVTINSLDPAACCYRPDLAESLCKVGSIF